jgi:hypothetical protein
MRSVVWGLVFALVFATSAIAQRSRVDLEKPLVLAGQGSIDWIDTHVEKK